MLGFTQGVLTWLLCGVGGGCEKKLGGLLGSFLKMGCLARSPWLLEAPRKQVQELPLLWRASLQLRYSGSIFQMIPAQYHILQFCLNMIYVYTYTHILRIHINITYMHTYVHMHIHTYVHKHICMCIDICYPPPCTYPFCCLRHQALTIYMYFCSEGLKTPKSGCVCTPHINALSHTYFSTTL